MRDDLPTLVRDESHASSDPREAAAMLRTVCAAASIQAIGDTFGFRQRTRGDDRLHLTTVQLVGDAHVQVEIQGVLGVGHLRDGALRAVSNGDAIDPDAAFLLHPGDAEAWTAGVTVDLIGLDLGALGAYATGGVPAGIVVPNGHARTPQLERRWQLTVDHVAAVLDEPELLGNHLIRQTAVDAVFATALSAFGITAAREPEAVGPGTLRRAVEFIEANLARPIGLADIAAAAHVGPRALQHAFQRAFELSPTAYLRAERLRVVHRELDAASPTDTTVADVARRWGFAHLPRFATQYRAAFAELPSETLRAPQRGAERASDGQSQPR